MDCRRRNPEWTGLVAGFPQTLAALAVVPVASRSDSVRREARGE